jgi:hypothetical protein
VIARRASALRDKGVAALKQHLERAQGRHIAVLMENDRQGRAADFTPVRVTAGADAGTLEAGMLIETLVRGHDGKALTAVGAR